MSDECLRPIIVLLLNVLGRIGAQVHQRQDFYGLPMAEGFLAFVRQVLAENIKSFDETPIADSCLLLGYLVQTLDSSSSKFVAAAVDTVTSMLKAKNSPATQSCSLFVICSSLVALPLHTLEYCSKTAFWPTFQTAWIGGEIPEPGTRLKSISLLGKLTLLKLDSDLWSKVAFAQQLDLRPNDLLRSLFSTADALLKEVIKNKSCQKQQECLHEELLLENIDSYFAETDDFEADFEDEDEAPLEPASVEERRRAKLEQKLHPLFQIHESSLVFESDRFGDAVEHFTESVAGIQRLTREFQKRHGEVDLSSVVGAKLLASVESMLVHR